jgi:hypothetical protein
MEQIYHPYWIWEDYINGMWRKVSQKEHDKYLPIAIAFTGDYMEYGTSMINVVNNWKYSCEHNLTDTGINRLAWIGHAACCLKHNIPEYITREAWGYLTKKQQDLANNEAQKALDIWISKHENKNTSMDQTMGIQGIFDWYSRLC